MRFINAHPAMIRYGRRRSLADIDLKSEVVRGREHLLHVVVGHVADAFEQDVELRLGIGLSSAGSCETSLPESAVGSAVTNIFWLFTVKGGTFVPLANRSAWWSSAFWNSTILAYSCNKFSIDSSLELNRYP